MDNEVNNNLIFIGGSGRSGTNILRNLLSKHSQVASLPFEYRFIIDPDGIVDFYNSFISNWSPYYSDVKIKRLNSFLINLAEKNNIKSRYVDWELSKYFPNYIENVQKLISDLKCFEYKGSWPGANKNNQEYKIWFSNYKNNESIRLILRNFIETNICDFLELNNKKYFIEDNTWNILYAKELHELIPESKIIHIIRDPRDVVVSFTNQSWCPEDLRYSIDMYKSIMKKWFEVELSLNKSKFKLIKLEELVRNKESVIKEICHFSNLTFENNLLDIDLTKHNSGRWQKELNSEDKKTLNKDLEDLINKLDY